MHVMVAVLLTGAIAGGMVIVGYVVYLFILWILFGRGNRL